MCGIVGYIGNRQASEVIMDGLQRLEYRGYDSSGLAVLGERLIVERAAGKLLRLKDKLAGGMPQGTLGIGHTRWATHGRPSDENAHPHEANGIVVVHNGIIENHLELRARLQKKGAKFRSETDTEVLAHLVADWVEQGRTFVDAVRAALAEVVGAYAVVFMSAKDKEHIVCARVASPLILGFGDGEALVASDIPALLPYTRRIMPLEENEFAVLSRQGIVVSTLRGEPVKRAPRIVDWSPAMAERGGYKHFMLKEIFEQPQALADTLRGRIDLAEGRVLLDEPGVLDAPVEHVVVLGMGTSRYAGEILAGYVERFARIPCHTELASEFRYRDPVVPPNTLCVVLSQSGETADTIAGAKEAKRRGARVLTICNVMDSSLARLADARLYTRAGVEIGVASTKAYTTQIACGYLLALALAEKRGTLDKAARRERLEALMHVPTLMNHVLQRAALAEPLAKAMHHAQSVLFLGRGFEVATACEGALKLKELSYVHAEGYAAGEMKHGPIALIDENFFVVVVGANDATKDKLLSSVQEVKARGGRVLSVVPEGDLALLALSELSLTVPPANAELGPLLNVLPLQLLAYDLACLRGNDVDQPRNLAKSVTVE